MNKKLHRRKLFFGVALLAIVGLLFFPAIVTACASAASALPTAATLGLGLMAASPFVVSRICLDHSGGDGNGPSLGDIAEKVEKGLGEIRNEQKSTKEKLLSDIGNLDKQSKSLLEDITKLKQSANDTQAGRDELLKKINLLDARITMQLRHSIVDPVQRIVMDEEKRTRFNCAIRLLCDSNGDMRKLMAPQLKALGEDSSPGSTLIDDALAREIYDTLTTFGIWNTFGVRNVGTKQTKYPLKTARPVANWVLSEGGTISDDTNKAGSSATLEIELLAVLLNVSIQLLEDSEFDVTRDVMEDFMEALSYRLDWSTVRADGTADATDGGFTGCLESWTAATSANGNTTVEALDFEDVTRVLLTVDPIVLSRRARWWLHPQILVRMLSIKDDNGRPIFLTALEAPAAGSIGSILGYPVTLGYIMPTTNSASAKVAAFGDPQSHVVGIRRAFDFASSDHHKWSEFQRSFRGVGRAGVKTRSATGGAVLTLAAA